MAHSKHIGDLERDKFWLRNGGDQNYSPLFVMTHGIPLASGDVLDWSFVNKFGAVIGASTTIVDLNQQVTPSIYTWPTNSFTVECISSGTSAASDTLLGTAARKVTVFGLDSDFNDVSETFNMNGATVTSAGVQTFTRIHRAYVSECGTYNQTDVGPNAGDITVRTTGAGQIHIQLLKTIPTIAFGQSQVARYTIPSGYTGYLQHIVISSGSNKPATFYLWQRPNADTTSAPFSPKRLIDVFDGVNTTLTRSWEQPIKMLEKTDVWMSVKGSGADTNASAAFDIILVRNT